MTDIRTPEPEIDAAAAAAPAPMQGLLKTLSRVPDYARLVFGLLWDARVSLADRLLVGASVVYLISPLDILPDVFPVLGQIDDLFFIVFSLTRLFERAQRHVVLSHWKGRPEELSARALRRLIFVASFFTTPQMRRRLRSLARPG
jgi:uncharacterized membrane protein YkvA (DUF1232 family)